MRQAIFPHTRRGLIVRLTLVAIVVALVVAFEISVRQLTPDALQYSVTQTTLGHTDFSFSRTITDPATIARWRAAMTATPSGQYIWQVGGGSCAPLSQYTATYIFFWHGIPVEVVSERPVCGEQYEISSGGIPAPRSYTIGWLVQPCQSAPSRACYY